MFIRSPLAHTIARYLISLQILCRCLLVNREGHLPEHLAGLGLLTLIFASNLRTPAAQHQMALL